MEVEEKGNGRPPSDRPLVVFVSSPTPAWITYGPLLSALGELGVEVVGPPGPPQR